jgi:hypothetical protein
MRKVTREPEKSRKGDGHRNTSTRQDLPIKRPRNSLKIVIVGMADPAGKVPLAHAPPQRKLGHNQRDAF